MFGLKFRRVKEDEAIMVQMVERITEGACDNKIHDVLKAEDSVVRLNEQIRELEDELAKLKSKKRLEDAEFKGLIKLREDRLNLDLEKKSVALDKEYSKKEMELLKKGHEQHVQAIADQTLRLDKFMEDAMDCLKSSTATAAPKEVVK
jgi:hypothetical protein